MVATHKLMADDKTIHEETSSDDSSVVTQDDVRSGWRLHRRLVKRFVKAALAGDLQEVQFLTGDPNLDVNGRRYPEVGETALIAACTIGQDDVAMFLADHPDVDLNLTAWYGNATALIAAVRFRNLNLVRHLVSKPNIHINERGDDGESALHEAVGFPKAVHSLLSHPKVDVNLARCSDGSTPLHKAVRMGCQTTVQMLLAQPNVDANARLTTTGRTPLHLVCVEGTGLQIAALLLRHHSIDPYATDNEGHSVLDIAYEYDEDIWRTLLLNHTIRMSQALGELLTELCAQIERRQQQCRIEPFHVDRSPAPCGLDSEKSPSWEETTTALGVVQQWLLEVIRQSEHHC